MTNLLNDNPTTKICWSAVLAGTVSGLMVQVLLNLLGVGLGFVAFTFDQPMLKGLSIGTTGWLIVSGVMGMFLGGWVAGKSSQVPEKIGGMLHGLTVWAMGLLVALLLMTSTAGYVMDLSVRAIGQSISMAGKGVASVGSGLMNLAPSLVDVGQQLMPEINASIEELQTSLKESGQASAESVSQGLFTESMKQQLGQLVKDYLTESNNSGDTRQRVVDFLTKNMGLSQQQAEQKLTQWQEKYQALKEQANQKYEENKQTVMENIEQTSTGVGTLALIAFFSLLTGMIAAMAGGLWAVKKD